MLESSLLAFLSSLSYLRIAKYLSFLAHSTLLIRLINRLAVGARLRHGVRSSSKKSYHSCENKLSSHQEYPKGIKCSDMNGAEAWKCIAGRTAP